MNRSVNLKNRLLGVLNAPAFSMLAVAALSLVLYRRALGFAFFNDDPTGNFHWMENRSLLQLFLTSEGYGFYRPLTFAVWKALRAAFGGYHAVGFHAFPVLLHAANTALVWLLAFYLSGRRSYAWLASLAFAAFPLSYEAVGYVAATFHPLVACWTLLTVLLYRRARESGSSRHLVGAHATLLLGLLTHENGLVIPFVLLGWELLTRPVRSLRELLRRPVYPFFIAPILFGLLWLSISKSGEQGLQSSSAVLSNVLPFLQALTYPLLPVSRLTAANVLGLLALSLATLIFTYLLARVAQAGRLWAFAVAWFVVTALPATLFLEPVYLYGSPRLYYLASIGVALLWGLPVLALARFGSRAVAHRRLSGALTACLALAILLPPLPLIDCQLDFFAQASHIVRSMRDHASNASSAREVIYLNLPFYFSSYGDHPQGCRNPYPFAPTGVVVIPPYASVRDFLRVNGGPDRPAHGYTFSGYDPGWNTYGDDLSSSQLRDLLGDAHVSVFDLVSGSVFDLSRAWHPDAPDVSKPQAIFDQIAALESTTVDAAGGHIRVTLRWRALDAPLRSLTVFVHLYDQSGTLVGQHDGAPARNYAPTSLWEAGDVIDDTHVVVLEASPPPGTYSLAVGLYDPSTTTRLPAYSAEGIPLHDSAYLVGDVVWP